MFQFAKQFKIWWKKWKNIILRNTNLLKYFWLKGIEMWKWENGSVFLSCVYNFFKCCQETLFLIKYFTSTFYFFVLKLFILTVSNFCSYLILQMFDLSNGLKTQLNQIFNFIFSQYFNLHKVGKNCLSHSIFLFKIHLWYWYNLVHGSS